METRTIEIRVDAETADAYEASSAAERQKLDLLVNLKLREVVKALRPLEEVIADLSRKAQERGLTPEILDSILTDS
ncbi:MAG: hypothetical protein AAFR99_20800 [Cyanobacteria bacterium J06629_9]